MSMQLLKITLARINCRRAGLALVAFASVFSCVATQLHAASPMFDPNVRLVANQVEAKPLLDGPENSPLVVPKPPELEKMPVMEEMLPYFEGGHESLYGPDFDFWGIPGCFCPPGWAVSAEALYFRPEGRSVNPRSSAFTLGYSDDNDLGGRFTIQRHFDCLDGWEVSYVGPFEWVEERAAVGANLVSNLGFVGDPLLPFNNAAAHYQRFTNQMNSVEFNQKWWGWDVIATSVGMRYVQIEEQFIFASQGMNGDQGLLITNARNDLVGAQAGIELLWPMGIVSTATKLKGGVFANIDEADVFLASAGNVLINNSPNDVDLAAMAEFGYYGMVALTPNITLRGGYEFWYFHGLATANRQISSPATFSTNATGPRSHGDLWYHGASLGLEIMF